MGYLDRNLIPKILYPENMECRLRTMESGESGEPNPTLKAFLARARTAFSRKSSSFFLMDEIKNMTIAIAQSVVEDDHQNPKETINISVRFFQMCGFDARPLAESLIEALSEKKGPTTIEGTCHPLGPER